MVEAHPLPDSNIVEIVVDGAFTRADFERTRSVIEDAIARHGNVRVLEVIRTLGTIEPSALWEDLKFAPKHMKDFSHAAVVAEQRWIEWLTVAFSPLISAEIRYFKPEHLEEARRWIRHPEERAA